MSRLAGLQRTTVRYVQFVHTCEVYIFYEGHLSFSLCDAAQFCLLYFCSLSLNYLLLSNLVEARIMFIFWHWLWHIRKHAKTKISEILERRSITLFASFPFCCLSTLYPVLWIGIVLMPIRIRISMLMTGRIGINMIPILMRILPQVLHILENPIQVFWTAYNEKSTDYQLFPMPRIDIDSDRPNRIGIPWTRILTRIRDLARWYGSDPIHIGIHNTVMYRFVVGNNGQGSDALARFSVNRFQKLFAVVTWYLVCLVFNLYRFVWGGVPKAVYVMMETGKDGVFFLHIYRSQSVHFHFQNIYFWFIWFTTLQ
jgi:hypothetical protein